MILQTAEIERLKLPRIVDDRQLHDLEYQGELVRIPENEQVSIDPNIPADRRYARLWTRDFICSLGRDFHRTFGAPVRITSAVRTEQQQQLLRATNRYAVEPTKSSHTTGITFDVSKRQLTRQQYKWMTSYFKNAMAAGWAEVSEEPACFHVAVMEEYNVAKEPSVL